MADKPPYTSSGDVDTFLSKIEPVGPPARMDADWVQKYGVAAQQASGITALAEWLGIIQEDGTTNRDVWNEVRLPTSRKGALDRLVRESYKAVFSALDVEQADRATLTSTFVHTYDLGDSRRYVRCFLKLCDLAGITTKAALRASPGAAEPKPKASNPQPAAQPKPKANSHQQTTSTRGRQDGHQSFISISLNVEIPAEWDEQQIRDRVALVTKAAQGG